MEPIYYIDRLTGKKEKEIVYGARGLGFLYGKSFLSQTIGRFFQHIVGRYPFFSAAYGKIQSTAWSKNQVQPFIESYQVDTSDFLEDVDSYSSFQEFFIRKLKVDSRPMSDQDAVIFADGRYLFFENISLSDGFLVKGKKFSLESLLLDKKLSNTYEEGSMVLARLCPVDYHRFHFPCEGVPSPSRLINGYLYSVNPIALKQNIDIYVQNKRMICEFETEKFGKVLYIEIGATNVGSITQTYTPNQLLEKGAEKGYFSFGASSIVLLFEKNRIQFDHDLLEATAQNMEIRCRLGQSMGKKI